MQTNTNAFMRTSPTNQNVHKGMITNDNEFDPSAIRQSAHVDVGSFSLMCEEALKPGKDGPGVLCYETKDNPICGNIGPSINTFYKLVINKLNLENLMLKLYHI